MSVLKFFWQGLKNLKTIGTVTRTTSKASKYVADLLDYNHTKIIVELGAGDGAITSELLNRLSPESKLIALEVNEKFCKTLISWNDPRLVVIQDSAEQLQQHLDRLGVHQPDAIVSALPFALISENITESILRTCKKNLRPGGVFIQIHYSLARKQLYESIFGNIEVKRILPNIPPLHVIKAVNASPTRASEILGI